MMQYHESRAFFEKRKKLRLLRLGDLLWHVIERDDVVSQQILAPINGRVRLRMSGVCESDLRVVLEDLEKRLPLETVPSGDEKHFDFCFSLCGQGSGHHPRRQQQHVQ